MSIEDRNLKAGTKLVASYKGTEYTAEVLKTKDGLRYRLEGDREFKSPSSAGRAVMGGSACNGWRFWTVASETPEEPATTATAQPAFEPMEDQVGAPEGQVRYFCTACMDGFTAPEGIAPVGCPNGHTNES